MPAAVRSKRDRAAKSGVTAVRFTDATVRVWQSQGAPGAKAPRGPGTRKKNAMEEHRRPKRAQVAEGKKVGGGPGRRKQGMVFKIQ